MIPIRWASDLHLDHADDGAIESLHAALRRGPSVPVILTGDLSTAPDWSPTSSTWLPRPARRSGTSSAITTTITVASGPSGMR